jgi:hypothetical protein
VRAADRNGSVAWLLHVEKAMVIDLCRAIIDCLAPIGLYRKNMSSAMIRIHRNPIPALRQKSFIAMTAFRSMLEKLLTSTKNSPSGRIFIWNSKMALKELMMTSNVIVEYLIILLSNLDIAIPIRTEMDRIWMIFPSEKARNGFRGNKVVKKSVT